MTVLPLCIRYCVIISLFALFIRCCVYYCIDVYFHHVAAVVEINSIQFNMGTPLFKSFLKSVQWLTLSKPLEASRKQV